jgi:hypothetical protein
VLFQCNLRHLSLSGCKLGDKAVRIIAMALGESKCSIETLNLSDNGIDAAAAAIAGKSHSMSAGENAGLRCPRGHIRMAFSSRLDSIEVYLRFATV